MLNQLFIVVALFGADNELVLSKAKAVVAIEAVSNKSPAKPVTPDDKPNPNCKCRGTGKSGDGLGPCLCGSNCKCAHTMKPTTDFVDALTPVNAADECKDGVCPVITTTQPADTITKQLQRLELMLTDIRDALRKPVSPPTVVIDKTPEVKPTPRPAINETTFEVLLFSSASGDCHYCNMVEADLIAGKLPKFVRRVRFDTDARLYSKYNITRVPTFVVLKNGVETTRKTGYLPPDGVAKLKTE